MYRSRFERSKATTVPEPHKKLTEVNEEWLIKLATDEKQQGPDEQEEDPATERITAKYPAQQPPE